MSKGYKSKSSILRRMEEERNKSYREALKALKEQKESVEVDKQEVKNEDGQRDVV